MKQKQLTVLLTIFIVISLVLGGCIIYGKVLKENTKKEELVDQKENNSKNSATSSLKIDEAKNWVYDADYPKNVSADSYATSFKTYYAKDIVVPFINIEGSDAKKANQNIKVGFDEAIKTYNEGGTNKTSYVDDCSYKNYSNSDILSVITILSIGGTDVVHPVYHSYNFDVKRGKALSFSEVYKAAGFTSSNINTKVEEAITKTMKEKLSSFQNSYSQGQSEESYIKKSIDNYKATVKNNTLEYFLGNNVKLSIIVTLNIPAGTEEFNTIIEVE